jgi:hypothetical protein
MGFAKGINDFMESIFGSKGLLGKSGISKFLGEKVAKPVLKAAYGNIIGKGSSDWKGSDIARALAGFAGMGAGAEYMMPTEGGAGFSGMFGNGIQGLWDNVGSGASSLWDKVGSGANSLWDKLGPELNPVGAGGDSGGMGISQLSDMLKGMGSQQNQSGGNQSLEPLYRLLEATKQGQNVPPAPIQPLPPMRSMF